MINSASHDKVSRLVADRPICLATALDKAFEKIDCMIAILRCQAKNRFYESTQRLIQPRRVLWFARIALTNQEDFESLKGKMAVYIIHAVRNGERDPVRLGAKAVKACAFSVISIPSHAVFH